MATITQAPAETRTLIENISWNTFVAIADERRGSVPRLTYDEGTLELMSPRRQHESIGRVIGRIIETYTEVKGIEIQSVASTTFKRADLSKGFEADESYYIEHAARIRAKEEIDLSLDPPPDLVIEVEITSSAIQKLKLFASMEIPEVWRHDGEHLQMLRLVDGQYQAIQTSFGVPGLSAAMVIEVLAQRLRLGETENIRRFRASITS
jgi:Uma2 family endonuclease